jgi:hypothetical protein
LAARHILRPEGNQSTLNQTTNNKMNTYSAELIRLCSQLAPLAEVLSSSHELPDFDSDRLILTYGHPSFDPWGVPSRMATISVLPRDGKDVDRPCIHVVSDGERLYYTEGITEEDNEIWEKDELIVILKKPFSVIAHELRGDPVETMNMPALQYEEWKDHSGRGVMYGVCGQRDLGFSGAVNALHVISRWDDFEAEGEPLECRSSTLLDLPVVIAEPARQFKELCNRLELKVGSPCPWTNQMRDLEMCLRHLEAYHWRNLMQLVSGTVEPASVI